MADLLQLYCSSYSNNFTIFNDCIMVCSYVWPILLNMILMRKLLIHFVSGWHDYYVYSKSFLMIFYKNIVINTSTNQQVANNFVSIHVCMYVPYITNYLRWKGFVVFMDWLVTAKFFTEIIGMATWVKWHYYTPMELWIFSSKLHLSSITTKFFYLEQFAIIQYVNL